MTDDFGVDLDEVYALLDRADVLVVRFHMIPKRLLADFRTRPGVAPLVQVVPPAESIEDRFKSIRRLRPEFPAPEKVMSFNWPRSMEVLLTSGVWQRLVDRVSALGGDEARDECGRAMEALLAEERLEVMGAIRGANHYRTLWERQRA
ncbi:MAG: hypothetical protein HS107_08880 [Thermoflexaceae bacterium]|nr:hypothetical protein [Thermoflexaceae bacterium]